MAKEAGIDVLDVNDRKALLSLSLLPNIGNGTLKAIYDEGLGFQEAWRDPDVLAAKGIMSKTNCQRLGDLKRDICPDMLFEKMEREGISILTRWDDDYPSRLEHLHDVPALLYIRGCASLLDRDMVAVVGARKATVYGKRVAQELGKTLGEIGITVISGLARGIDSSAHRGAIANLGSTIAVLGSGVDVVYPRENEELYREIMEKGLIISEFPPGTKPEPRNFPRRNRIIAALAYAVVVVEAGEKSGALITADLALEMGREVWAVPGPITSPQSVGTNRLIRDGAMVMLDPADIVRSLKPEATSVNKMKSQDLLLTLEEEKVLLSLGQVPVNIDELKRETGISHGELSVILLNLEMKGIIACQPGNYYVRIS